MILIGHFSFLTQNRHGDGDIDGWDGFQDSKDGNDDGDDGGNGGDDVFVFVLAVCEVNTYLIAYHMFAFSNELIMLQYL